MKKNNSEAEAEPAGLAAASAADNDYIMCPGDQLQVVVYGHEDLEQSAQQQHYSLYSTP